MFRMSLVIALALAVVSAGVPVARSAAAPSAPRSTQTNSTETVDTFADRLLAATDAERDALLSDNPALVTELLVDVLMRRGAAALDREDREGFVASVRAYVVAEIIARRLRDLEAAARALERRGFALVKLGDDINAAIVCLDAAYEITAADASLRARIEGVRAEAYFKLGRPAAAHDAASRAVAGTPSSDHVLRGQVLTLLARARAELGLFEVAFPAFRQAAAAFTEARRPDKVLDVLHEEAVAYSRMNRPDESVRAFEEILKLIPVDTTDAQRRARRRTVMANLALDLALSDRPLDALRVIDEMAPLLEGANDVTRASVLLTKGLAIQRACELVERARIRGESGAGTEEIARACDLDAAKRALDDALHIAGGSTEDEASGLLQVVRTEYARALLGTASPSAADVTRAIELTKAALEATDPSDREGLWHAHLNLGNAYFAAAERDRAFETKALEELTACTVIIDSIVADIGDDPQAIADFLADKAEIYGTVAAKTSASRPEQGLLALEKARARGLLAVVGRGAPRPDDALEPADRERLALASARLEEANRQVEESDAAPKRTAETRKAALDRRAGARDEFSSLRFTLARRYPWVYRKARTITPLLAVDLKELVESGEVAYLEYLFNEIDAVAFLVTRGAGGAPEVRSFRLGSPTPIFDAVRRLRVAVTEDSGEHRAPARELFDALVAPALPHLGGARRVVVVPDGALWHVPFQALMAPDERFLIETLAVSYAPALSFARDLRRVAPISPRTATFTALVNPEVRPGQEPTATSGHPKTAEMSAPSDPLPAIEDSAKRVVDALGSRRARSFPRSKASEERFRAEAAKGAVLFLGAHGVLEDGAPLYSRIYLSPTGRTLANDGVLEAWEVLEMSIPAPLVVLAACETARGVSRPGEGLLGLAWAFSVAGCPRLVAAEWRVPEPQTARLMNGLFKRVFGNTDTKAGARTSVPIDVALQEAAKDLIRDSATKSPYNWAGFRLIGDWR